MRLIPHISRECFALHDATRLSLHGAAPGASWSALADLRDALHDRAGFVFRDGALERPGVGYYGYFCTRTSGTTGARKVIRRSHASWIASFEVHRTELGLGPQDAYAILGSLDSSVFLYAFVEAAHLGADIQVIGTANPKHQARLLAQLGSSVLYLTPTVLGLLCDSGATLPAVRHILCGGGPASAALVARARILAPNAQLRLFYGSAETSFVAWGDGSGPPGTVGQPYPGVEIMIDPPDAPVGEVWVRSPYLFSWYDGAESPDTRWRGNYLSVGEWGRMTDGHLAIVGRRNRMVTIADTNVFPEEIEAFLDDQPGVERSAVVPRQDARRGTILVAAVATRDGPPDLDRLLRACRDRFGPLAAPRRIVHLPALPMTDAGKPDLDAIGEALGDAP